MAEGLLRSRFGDRFEVFSAGTEPARVHPTAVAVMREIGIDITSHSSKHVDELIERIDFDVVVTVCDAARETCPYVPARQRSVHHSFRDPSAVTETDEATRLAFREVRDEISAWIDDAFTEDGTKD